MRDQARQVAWTSSWKRQLKEKITQKNYTRCLNQFTLPKLSLERQIFYVSVKMQVDDSKSCQETDLVDLEVPTDENFVAASWAVGGRAQENSLHLFYIFLLARLWTHGRCIVGSCAFSFGRLGLKRVNLVVCVCLLCVCLKILKKLRSRIHLLPFSDFQDVYFDALLQRKLGIKLCSNCCCYGNSKRI